MNIAAKIAARHIASEIGKPQNAEMIERQLVAKAESNPVFALRQEKRAKIAAISARIVSEARCEGRQIDYDAFVRETSAVESEYAAKETALLGPVKVGNHHERLPKPELRLWGRI